MYHTEATVAALKAGKHVLCEKPLAPTPADIKKMIAARDKSGKLLMTAQHFRFDGLEGPQSGGRRGTLGNITTRAVGCADRPPRGPLSP
jgi:hypothetical protein